MELEGNVFECLVVNTTDYNGDGRWSAQSAKLDELEKLGFDGEEVLGISWLPIGGVMSDFDHKGVIVIRVA